MELRQKYLITIGQHMKSIRIETALGDFNIKSMEDLREIYRLITEYKSLSTKSDQFQFFKILKEQSFDLLYYYMAIRSKKDINDYGSKQLSELDMNIGSLLMPLQKSEEPQNGFEKMIIPSDKLPKSRIKSFCHLLKKQIDHTKGVQLAYMIQALIDANLINVVSLLNTHQCIESYFGENTASNSAVSRYFKVYALFRFVLLLFILHSFSKTPFSRTS